LVCLLAAHYFGRLLLQKYQTDLSYHRLPSQMLQWPIIIDKLMEHKLAGLKRDKSAAGMRRLQEYQELKARAMRQKEPMTWLWGTRIYSEKEIQKMEGLLRDARREIQALQRYKNEAETLRGDNTRLRDELRQARKKK